MKTISKSLPIFYSDLSVRAKNILLNNGDLFGVEVIPGYPYDLTVAHLAKGSKRELSFRRGAGPKSIKEIENLCARAGVKMKE